MKEVEFEILSMLQKEVDEIEKNENLSWDNKVSQLETTFDKLNTLCVEFLKKYNVQIDSVHCAADEVGNTYVGVVYGKIHAKIHEYCKDISVFAGEYPEGEGVRYWINND